MTGVSAVTAVSHGHRRRHRRAHDRRRRPRDPRRADDARRLRDVHLLHRPRGGAGRVRSRRSARRSPRPSPASIASAKCAQMATEDAGRRRARADRRRSRGDVEFEDVRFEYDEGVDGAQGRVVPRAGGHDDGAGRLERVGQEHAHQPGDGVQPAAVRPRSASTGATCRGSSCATTAASSASCCRTTSSSTARSPTTSASRKPGATRARDRSRRPHRALRRVRRRLREGLRHGRRRARREAVGRPAPARRDRARDPGRSADPDPRRGDVEPRQRERGADPGRPASAAAAAARPSSSRTACRRSAAPIRSSCSSTARSSSAARTSQLLALGGRYRQLYDKQYNFEQDRFINPGEDFTPEPVKEAIPTPTTNRAL